MFRSVPMLHMQIQVPNRDAAAATRVIASAGLLHLVDIAHGRVAVDAAPAGTHELLAAFRDLAARVRRVGERIGMAVPDPIGAIDQGAVPEFTDEREAVEAVLVPIEEELDRVATRLRTATEEADAARRALRDASRLRQAGVPLDRLAAVRFTTLVLGLASNDGVATLAALLPPVPFAIVPLDEPRGGDRLVAVAVPASAAPRLEASLRLTTIERLQLPAQPDAWAPDPLLHRAESAEGEARGCAQQLEAASARHRTVIGDLWARVDVAVLLLQAQTHFGASGRFVVISGWLPEDGAAALAARVTERTAGRAVIATERPEDMPETYAGALQIPILHRNPLLLRPFESLVELYDTPSYRELQPTALLALTFLLMFGLMFGDVGHGLVLFSAGYCLFRYLPRYLDYGLLLMECGAASAVFGVLFGSLFGVEGLLPVLWMEPIRDLPRFMALAVGFGVLLISLGLVLNVVNAWRAGERVAALFSTRGMLGAFLYWAIVAVIVRELVPQGARLPGWVPVTLLVGAVALLVLRRPIVALLERGRPSRRPATTGPWVLSALEASIELADAMFGFFANTMSFVRIAAFAAVHAGLFVALFALSDTLKTFTFGGPLSVVALVAGNVVMVLLEGLVVSVQVLRLEYYEFFGKFFRGGGEAYRPLMLRARSPKGGSS